LTVYGDNTITYSGALNINAGTIKAGNSNALGSGSITVASGATLDINGQPLDYPFVTVSGDGVGGKGAIANSGSAQTNAMTKLTLQGDTTLSSSNRWDFIPGISTFLGQDHALTKVGPGEIRLNIGSDTGLGDIDIKEGRLIFGFAGTDLGNTANTITVRSNASLSFTGGIAAGAKPTTVLPGGFIEAAAGVNVSSNSYAGDITFLDRGVFRLGTLAQLEVSGSISSPSGVVNADVGTLILSGSNHYSGDLTVRRGPVTIASSNALPSGTTVNMDGDTENQGVFLSLANDVSTPVNVPLNMKSYRTPSGPRTPRLDGQGTWTGPINLIGIQLDPSQNPQITIGGSSNLTISGPVTQSGSPLLSLNIEGFPGTVKFESPLQYNGTMRMGSQGLGIDPDLTGKITTLELASSNNAFTNMLFWRGKIKISANDAIPVNCPITTSFVRTDNDARGIIDLNGHFQTFSNFPGITGTMVAMPVWFGNDSTNSDATIIFQSAITNSWNCWILDNLDTNIVSARKTGLSVTSGFLRLAPWSWTAWFDPSSIVANTTSNTYTGPTLVTGGGLQVDTWLGNTPVTVSGSGILAGKGPFNAPVVVAAGGTLSPGGNVNVTTAVGWMTNSSTLTLQSGSQCHFEVNLTAKTNDAVVGLDTVTYGGTLLITNVGAQAITNGSAFRLFSATNYVAGPLAIQPAIPGTGLVWDTSTMAIDGTLRVASAPSAPVIGSYGTTSDGNFAVTVNGVSGQQYSLFAGTNVAAPLNTWTLIQSGTQVGSTITLFDLGATNHPTRFYRISTP
jgi:autotransporter-associated beta strand protein